ncbi:hypothetical protein G8S49_05880 [Clostridium botulinum C]|uniref:Uncharacterized protein n=1 Tax=Clostridium botulinum C TaxID=36828 RepID=A0A9Q3V9X7_CLOBO|nr:hypothetical protein [Clostridium botulinum]YP_398549.1 hypothetical protein CST119 [Clostridium phage c-st]KEH99816.1 hypothetical protein Z952_p0145 [Clostridium botulinum C/D str. BKT75002]KEI05294.1 hypothetical protein Z954_0146 [Clostridium botulinum C/D str. BKT2873]MCD3194837.1 hypothetical protein [Clostridium botulinum C]MCD3200228.1 hypothetical protein [Clostridium botulinum C]MCD3205705.1 hypothetical protein [Clostridium botulinum C]
MKKYEINENVAHNLMLFLDRVELKGLKEIQAMNEIIDCFNSPIENIDMTNDNKTTNK